MTVRLNAQGEASFGDDFPLIRDVLGSYAIDRNQLHIEQPAHAKGFSGAIIRRITLAPDDDRLVGSAGDSTTFCLRGWPQGGLPAVRLTELHRFLRFVHERGVLQLPVPLPAVTGETLVAHRGRDWQFEPWMPGVADFNTAPSDARLKSAMTTLAQLHQVAARYQPTTAGREWFAGGLFAPSPAVTERLAIMDRWTGDRLQSATEIMSNDPEVRFGEIACKLIDRFRTSSDRVRTALRELQHAAVPLQVCLRDVWHDHVLFTGDTVTGLVDPSAARTESVATDLARLLGSLLGKPGERWDVALDAYDSIRPLSHDEHRLIRALQMSGALLSGMTWIDRRIRNEIPGDSLPAVVSRMNDFCAQLNE